jgi:glycosyltransferase involved in cell wall biosynthesis
MTTNSLSVVVSTMNRDLLLNEALHSLAVQTIKINQVIVVDDGGTGSSEKIVEKYGQNFQYFWQPNSGQQHARNFGISKASGNWIAFLDDDDIWEPNRSQIINLIIDKEAVDLIVGDFLIFNEKNIISNSFFAQHASVVPDFWTNLKRNNAEIYTIINSMSPLRLFPEYPFWGGMTVIKKEKLIEIGGWDESLRGIPSEDFDFVFRAIRKSRIGLIWEPTVRYRSHSGNVSHDGTKKMLGRVEIAKRLIKKEKLTNLEINFINHFIQDSQAEGHWTYFRRKDYQLVLEVARNWGWSSQPFLYKAKTVAAYLISKYSE